MNSPNQEEKQRQQEVPNAEFIWRHLGLPGKPDQCDKSTLSSESDLTELSEALERERERIGRLAKATEFTDAPELFRQLGLSTDPPKLRESCEGPEVDYDAIHAYVRGDADPDQIETVLRNREFRSWWKAECLIFQFEIQLEKLRTR